MSKRKNILIVSAVFPPEPVTSANMNYDLSFALSKKFNVTVLCPEPSRPLGQTYLKGRVHEASPFTVITMNSYIHPKSDIIGRVKESISFGKRCANFIKVHREEIDYVYNCSWHLFGYFLVAKVCVKYNIPYMIPIQDIYPETLFTNKKIPKIFSAIVSAALKPIDKYYLKHATIIRTISEEMKMFLVSSRNLDKRKFIVVNNWQDEDDYLCPQEKEKDGIFKFMYVGSINDHSNVDLMICAFNKANLPHAELLLYGGGNRKDYCQALVRERHIGNIFFSFVDKKDVPFVQANADVLLLALPTGNGTLCLPSKMTSYMLSGKPILASVDLDSTTAAYIRESCSGVVVKPDDEDALAKAFQQMASLDLDKLKIMGEGSRNFAINHLTKRVNLALVTDAIDGYFDNNS